MSYSCLRAAHRVSYVVKSTADDSSVDTVTDGEGDGDVDCHETGQPRPGFVSFDRYMRGYYK